MFSLDAWRRLLLKLACFGGLASSPAWAVDTWRAQANVDARKLVDDKKVMGIVVGLLSADGRREYFAHGCTRAEGPAPDERTIFEIGSISKTFTALVLAGLVTRGELRLETPVAELLPADWQLPERGNGPITLVQLATHTAGLPRLPASLFAKVAKDPQAAEDPYADYRPADLAADLAKLKIKPRKVWPPDYSNFGAGLLGYALCLRTGRSYEAMIAEYVARPLGLGDTMVAGTEEQRARRAGGHTAKLKPCSDWHFTDCIAGAGALRSTAADMLSYLAAQNGQVESPLAAAMALSHEQRDQALGVGHIGLGWFILRGPGDSHYFIHNGGTGGYVAYAAFAREPRVGVVVLCNTFYLPATDLVGSLGARLIEQLIKSEQPQQSESVERTDP